MDPDDFPRWVWGVMFVIALAISAATSLVIIWAIIKGVLWLTSK